MSGGTVEYAIKADGLEKAFGDRPVLWALDLTVGWGECLGLLGANGAGKTTLLRILSTQVRVDAGAVEVAGYDLRRRPDSVRRRVGVVAHDTFLYDDLTCLENLVYYGRLFGLKEPQRRAEETLERVGLANRANHRVRLLSHGMQKRVSIARAILHEPPVLLLDEPESGLDQGSVAVLEDLLTEWTASGRTVVMSTHNIEMGFSWASRVGLLMDGRIHFCGGPDDSNRDKFRELVTASLGAGGNAG